MSLRQFSLHIPPPARRACPALAGCITALLLAPSLLLAAGQEPGPAATLSSNSETLSLTAAIFKTAGALVLVIGLMLLLLAWIKKMGLARNSPGQGRLIKVLDMQMLAPKKHVAVLEVAGEYLAVAVTEQQVNLLARLQESDALRNAARHEDSSVDLPASFATVLQKARNAMSGTKKNRESK